MQSIRPVPISATSRVQSVTPMPQAQRLIRFRPMAQSPPPFAGARNESRFSTFEDGIIPRPQSHGTGNMPLLARGISLLSITQLREILREYSLPTGGNKQVLVNRLLIFLDTFGQNQPNLISQFSARLKSVLSVDNPEVATSTPSTPQETQTLMSAPVDSLRDLLQQSPSSLLRPVPDLTVPVGPISVPGPNVVGFRTSFMVPLPPRDGLVPILQLSPATHDTLLRRVTLQVGGVVSSLPDNALWVDLGDFVNRQTNVTLLQADPVVPLIIFVRWMTRVPLLELAQKIVVERESAPEIGRLSGTVRPGVCPLTKKLIARPARGVRCMHGDCFDLTGFLCYAIKNNSWVCPICHNRLTAEDLRVDPNYFKLASV